MLLVGPLVVGNDPHRPGASSRRFPGLSVFGMAGPDTVMPGAKRLHQWHTSICGGAVKRSGIV